MQLKQQTYTKLLVTTTFLFLECYGLLEWQSSEAQVQDQSYWHGPHRMVWRKLNHHSPSQRWALHSSLGQVQSQFVLQRVYADNVVLSSLIVHCHCVFLFLFLPAWELCSLPVVFTFIAAIPLLILIATDEDYCKVVETFGFYILFWTASVVTIGIHIQC